MSLLAALAPAQSTNSGAIRGTVTDSSGAVIPEVKVTVANINTGVTREYTTNSAGLYDTVSILPGKYRLTFSKEGFSTMVREGITLQVGAPLTVDAQLTVGTAQQQVQVSAEAPLIKTETGEQSTTLTSETMVELPNVTRNWANFAKTLPGTVGSGTGVSINGTMPYYANFLADGASGTNPHSANVNVSIFETIAEVQINTSAFSAQYGTGAIVFNQISKSGSNQWHGAAYEFVQNNAFNARNFFSPAVPITKYNNFGGSIAGPIKKNKLFFYFNTDKTINNTLSYQFFTVPTEEMRAGNFSNPIFPTIYDPTTLVNGSRTAFPGNIIPANRLDPLSVAAQKYFPAPNRPGFQDNLQAALSSRSPLMKYFGRLDYSVTDNNRLTVSVTQIDNPNFTPSPYCPINCYTGDVDSYMAQVSDVWTISPSLINEARMGFHREDSNYQPVNLGQGFPKTLGWNYAKADMFPGITIGGPVGGTNIGTSGSNPAARYAQNNYDPSDTVTWIHGKHILHLGGEVLMFKDNDTPWGNVQSGNFNFSGVFTARAPFTAGAGGLGYADFLLGQVQGWDAANSPINGNRQNQPQFFVQDDFKVTPKLTLNLGLRYQIMGGWYEKHNKMGTFDPTIMNPATNTLGAMWFSPNNGRNSAQASVRDIFLPRLGFAWSAKKDWVLRGGFGIYSYIWSQDSYGGASGLGASSRGSLSDTSQVQPLFRFSDPNPPLNYVAASRNPEAYNGQNVGFIPYNTPVARNYQWTLSLQRQFGSFVGEAAYVGNHVTGLPFPVDINQVPASKLGTSPTPQQLRPYPQFNNINGGYYNAISNYNAMQLSLKKRYSYGLTFDVNYTWSKMLSEQDSSGWSGNGGASVWQDAYNPGANYGFSNLHRTHLWKGSTVYQLPFGKGKAMLNRGGPVDWVLGGWQLSTILTYQSGAPFTPTMGGTNNSGALSGNWYPNLVGNPRVDNPTIQRWFNVSAFERPAPFTFGNTGRNILFGPSMFGNDFSMAKSFGLPKLESGRLQIRIDATNVLNHPSFSNPNASISTPNAGIITGTTVGGRSVQLGARLSF